MKQSDTDAFIEITKTCEVAFNPCDVTDIFCLGKKVDTNKPRPVLIKLSDIEKKKQLFKRLDLFRKHKMEERNPADESPLISISHDLTQDQRSERKALIDEAELKNATLDDSVPYRHRVRGPPWAMKIVQVKQSKCNSTTMPVTQQ